METVMEEKNSSTSSSAEQKFQSAPKSPELLDAQARLLAANKAAANHILQAIKSQLASQVSSVEKVSKNG